MSLHSLPDKHTKMISVVYENTTAAVKVGNEFSSWFCIKSGVSPNQMGKKNFLDLNLSGVKKIPADDLIILGETFRKMNEL